MAWTLLSYRWLSKVEASLANSWYFIFALITYHRLDLQQIANKPTTNFFVKAPLRGAFTKKLGLV